MSTFLIYQTFCRQDGGIASPPSLACTNPPKTALSLACTTTLASLVKGEVLSPEKIRATTGGIAAPPFQNRTITPTFRRANVCVCFICFASLRNFAHTRLRHPCLACPSRCTKPLHPHNPLKPPSTLIRTHPHSPFSPRVSPQLLLRFPHRQPRRRPTHNRICSSARRFAPLCLASPAFQPF